MLVPCFTPLSRPGWTFALPSSQVAGALLHPPLLTRFDLCSSFLSSCWCLASPPSPDQERKSSAPDSAPSSTHFQRLSFATAALIKSGGLLHIPSQQTMVELKRTPPPARRPPAATVFILHSPLHLSLRLALLYTPSSHPGFDSFSTAKYLLHPNSASSTSSSIF